MRNSPYKSEWRHSCFFGRNRFVPVSLRATVVAAAVTLAVATAWPVPATACDSDADCGGGTCIKREKRASGVCYGERRDDPAVPDTAMPDGYGAATEPGAVDIPDYVGNREAIREKLTPSGIQCMVTQQCPAGLECVIIEFQGTCMEIR